MPPTRPLKVFLCHASADKPAVRRLHDALRAEDWIDPWLDEEKLSFGQHWTTVIEDTLDAADVVLIFLSRNSVHKEGFVQRELNYAWELSLEKPRDVIFLIPFRLDDCEVPRFLRSRQWGDYFGGKEENTYQILLRSLKQRYHQKMTLEAEEQEQRNASQKAEREKIELEVWEKLAREKAKREKVELETKEKSTREKAERDAAEKAKREKVDQEAAENAKREKVVLEAKEKLALEKAERDAVEKAKREKIVLEASEKLARENAEREALAKAAREKTEREAKNKLAREKAKRITKPEPEKQLGTKLPSWGIGLIAFAALAVMVWGLSALPASPEPTQTPSATQTLFVEPATATKIQVPATSTATIIPTPTLGIGSIMNSEKDGATLVYVPEGEFLMGSKDTDSPSYDDEKPQHSVTLDAFWIDQTEVTNAMYAICVLDDECDQPSSISSSTRNSYFGNSEFDGYPVINVSWEDAKTYCLWADRRLPTEAEWEKAARGTDARIYPWGNDTPNSTLLLNYNQNVGDTTAVGNYQSGASLYGAYDMAGNVWEWVNDWYNETYYQDTISSNPLGPDSGQYRVLRGGSWSNNNDDVRSANRYWSDPAYTDDYVIGFRCSRSP
ncbi:MAG: SUMF1/EgtB/PvdO family nonheme iron enzyme [Chloroflexota bacterium]